VTTTLEQAAWDQARGGTDGPHARTSAHGAGEEHAATRPAPHDADERRLVARLKAGEAQALEELYLAYRKPVFGFLLRLAKDRYLAEDLFQNTWLKVSRSVERLRDDTEIKAWIFTVARNEFRSHRRWQLIDLSRIFLFYRDREAPEREAADESDESMALATLERGLAALHASDREVLLLVCVEGMDPQQAATVLGISHAALRQRLGRARARLKGVLAKLECESGDGQHVPARKP
jgi:RNA polymerase sigma-70 factor, ECF subfamily